MTIRVTYADITAPDGTTIERLHVTAGSTNIDLADAVRRDLTATIVDPTGALTPRTANDLLAEYVTEVTIRSGFRYPDGTEEVAPCGVFRITGLDITDLGGGAQLDVTGQDRAVIVRGASPRAVAIPAGSSIANAVQLLVTARYTGAAFTATDSPYTVPAMFYPANTDLWDAARQLASGAGLDLAVDATGVFVLRPLPSLGLFPPVVLTYGDKAGQYPMWAPKRSQSAGDTPNGVIVTGGHSSLAAPVRGEAWLTDPASPLRKDGPYGEQPVWVSSSTVSSSAQAALAARSELIARLGSADTISFSTIPNARADAGDVVAVDRELLALTGERWILTQATIPWGADEAMQVTAKRRYDGVETS